MAMPPGEHYQHNTGVQKWAARNHKTVIAESMARAKQKLPNQTEAYLAAQAGLLKRKLVAKERQDARRQTRRASTLAWRHDRYAKRDAALWSWLDQQSITGKLGLRVHVPTLAQALPPAIKATLTGRETGVYSDRVAE